MMGFTSHFTSFNSLSLSSVSKSINPAKSCKKWQKNGEKVRNFGTIEAVAAASSVVALGFAYSKYVVPAKLRYRLPRKQPREYLLRPWDESKMNVNFIDRKTIEWLGDPTDRYNPNRPHPLEDEAYETNLKILKNGFRGMSDEDLQEELMSQYVDKQALKILWKNEIDGDKLFAMDENDMWHLKINLLGRKQLMAAINRIKEGRLFGEVLGDQWGYDDLKVFLKSHNFDIKAIDKLFTSKVDGVVFKELTEEEFRKFGVTEEQAKQLRQLAQGLLTQ
eukprot:TRINITY_DN1753_c0_g1_i1.p1 TRINITY_DN1753_c0_g1~~TRINITY_DN1753_c0_g1_i1.p1  ORF type:complete len:277 (-),score=52.83 TRINITY_DN1753_c0_g1_i1:42-872(-)